VLAALLDEALVLGDAVALAVAVGHLVAQAAVQPHLAEGLLDQV
jgi:hypothetical protein